ncbi:MAG: hypothetical protein HWN67_07165 [Candidatus Helarchaeota archaeon]|nr:hypothetical protein [Candidatus Helarchaeota archaeon]
MECQKVVDKYKDLFSRIKRLKPLKDDTIFIKVENCLIKISRIEKQLLINIAKLTDRKGEMMVKFSDFSTLQQVLNAKDLIEYGERLLYAVLDRKIFLDPGNVEKATQSGFFKLISRSRFKKHIQIFELTIPVV